MRPPARVLLAALAAFALAPAGAEAMTVISPQPGDSTANPRPVFVFSGPSSVDEDGDPAPGYTCQLDGAHQPTPCDSGQPSPVALANGAHTLAVQNIAEGTD